MNIRIKKYDAHVIIKEIATQIQHSSRTDYLEEIIELPKDLGTGKIVGFRFSDGVSLLIFHCTLKNDWTLIFEENMPAPLQLNFNIKGTIKHSLNTNNIWYQMNSLQGTTTVHPADSTQRIQFLSDTPILFTTLFIDSKEYSEKNDFVVKQLPSSIQEILLNSEAKKTFFYQNKYSIAIATCLQKITEDKNRGLARSTFLESKVMELIYKQIKLYKDDLQTPTKQTVLPVTDLEKIKKAKELLIQDLVNPPTIEELAKLVGLNKQKLTQGFKKVFDKTINHYLRDERMEAGSILLLSDKSVREVAYEVGYVNQSHFAKRFKQCYGILPKDYLKASQARSR